jgi:hypothetical protein
MSFAQYFKLSSYCMIAAGFVAIAATGSIDPATIILFSSAMIASWFVNTVRLRQTIPVWVLNCIALACIPIGVLDYRYASHSLIVSIIHMVLFLASVKLLTCSRDGDFVFLYLISFAELLAASILTVDITIAACFFVFLISSVSTLVLFEMRRSNAATHLHAQGGKSQRMGTLHTIPRRNRVGHDSRNDTDDSPAGGPAIPAFASSLARVRQQTFGTHTAHQRLFGKGGTWGDRHYQAIGCSGDASASQPASGETARQSQMARHGSGSI